MLALFQARKETPRLATLRQLALFAPLSRLELRVVDGLLHERRYLKGEVIFDEGEEGQALYVIISGRVLICRQGEPETGRISEIDAGVAFGELALLDNAPARRRRGPLRTACWRRSPHRLRKAARQPRGDRVKISPACSAPRAGSCASNPK
jgi:CRP-like cAMP-binding protein